MKFTKLKNLKVHIESIVHKGTKNTQCESCGNYFAGKNNLNKHISKIHENDRKKNFACTLCSWAFYKEISLLKHQKAVHEKPERSKQCEICGIVFPRPRPNTVKAHLELVHEGLRKYSCEVCAKTYKTKSDLKKHFDYHHRGIKRYHCDSCDKKFVNWVRLHDHIDSVHKGIKKNLCQICDKTFYSKDNLRNHLSTVHQRPRIS